MITLSSYLYARSSRVYWKQQVHTPSLEVVKSPPVKWRKSLIEVDEAGGGKLVTAKKEAAASQKDDFSKGLEEYVRVDFCFKPKLSPKKSNKTKGKPKPNTQVSRDYGVN